MVLSSSLSRPLARSARSMAMSSSRGIHHVSAASAIASSNKLLRTPASSPAGLASRRAAAISPSTNRAKLGPSTTIRSLTGFPREKVKVLMVLYDGGKHAEEVSSDVPPPFSLHMRHYLVVGKN